MFIPIFTISPLIFIIGFTIFGKSKKKHGPSRRVEAQVVAGSGVLDFELLFFMSAIDSALILERKRQAPGLIGVATTNTREQGERVGT
jgi:hypothetical protein